MANAIFIFKCGNDACNAYIEKNKLDAQKLAEVKHKSVICKKCQRSTRWYEAARLKAPEKPKEDKPQTDIITCGDWLN